jgi:hypothetical protein
VGVTRTLLSVLLGAASLCASPLNGLYFGLDNMRGFQEVYWWFQPDGRLLRGLPASSLTAADFATACNASPSACATFSLNGNQLAVHYRDGRSETWTYKPLNGGFQLNYLILTPVRKFAAGTRLNGTWSAAYSATSHTAFSRVTATVPAFISFRPDGTFSRRVIAGIDTQSDIKGANTSSSHEYLSSGTYWLRDYALVLAGTGKSERHTIFPVAGGNLDIDGRVYTKQN